MNRRLGNCLWAFGVGLIIAISGFGLEPQEPVQKEITQPQEKLGAWLKRHSPGGPQERLQRMAGEWDVDITIIYGPGTPPVSYKGTSSNKMILGGRYLQQEFEYKRDDGVYRALGIYGYDASDQKYKSLWIDNMSTQMQLSISAPNDDGTAFTATNEVDDPLVSKKVVRSVTKIIDENKNIVTMYQVVPNGQDFRFLEITSTRKK